MRAHDLEVGSTECLEGQVGGGHAGGRLVRQLEPPDPRSAAAPEGGPRSVPPAPRACELLLVARAAAIFRAAALGLAVAGLAARATRCLCLRAVECLAHDDQGVVGPIERALEGIALADPSDPIEALRVVHSFDPYLQCSDR